MQAQGNLSSRESEPETSAADRIRRAHILSRAFLEQSAREQEIVHDFRASKDLKELIRTAERYGLRPVGVEIERRSVSLKVRQRYCGRSNNPVEDPVCRRSYNPGLKRMLKRQIAVQTGLSRCRNF